MQVKPVRCLCWLSGEKARSRLPLREACHAHDPPQVVDDGLLLPDEAVGDTTVGLRSGILCSQLPLQHLASQLVPVQQRSSLTALGDMQAEIDTSANQMPATGGNQVWKIPSLEGLGYRASMQIFLHGKELRHGLNWEFLTGGITDSKGLRVTLQTSWWIQGPFEGPFEG